MAEARYLARYSFAMKELLDYKGMQNDDFFGVHVKFTVLMKEGKPAQWNHRKTAILCDIHCIQTNIAWVVHKIEELEKLEGYKRSHTRRLEALLMDDEVKERLGNL